MYLRKNILPKSIQDAAVTSFVVIMIPTVYWFELFLVLPTFYAENTLWYQLHFVMATYILFNITSNLLAVMIYDTSIRGRLMSSDLQPNWRFCSVCESTAPPRSWHCNVCKTCILKRDHHCIFTSCCIGHHNYRYFLAFVFYMFVATFYATYFNIYFIWAFTELHSYLTIARIIFPLAMIFMDLSSAQMYLFCSLIVLIGCIFTGALLYYHVNLMLNGMVTYERNKKMSMYDFGKKQNIIEVLGERWYIVWVSPFIISNLPSDGITWKIKNTDKSK